MVRPGETGWLAEVGNVRALRATIEQVLSNDAERKCMGECARAVVEEEYSLEVQANRYYRLYKAMTSPHSSTSHSS